MGDRGNIVLKYGSLEPHGKSVKIFLYTHWFGTYIGRITRDALRRSKGRWGSEPYLARYIAEELTKAVSDPYGGMGISPVLLDNEHDLLVVDLEGQLILQVDDENPDTKPVQKWTFEQFAALADDERVITDWP